MDLSAALINGRYPAMTNLVRVVLLYFALAPRMTGVVWTSFNDFTIFSVTALYFLKCGASKCAL